jgi:hypothetical protein
MSLALQKDPGNGVNVSAAAQVLAMGKHQERVIRAF